MKKGWQTTKLADLIEVQNGFAFSSKDYKDSGHFIMRIGNVQNGYVSMSDPKFINLTGSRKLERFVLHSGDILVSLTGNVGRVGLIEDKHLPAALNQRVARITINKNSPAIREFLLLFLFSDWFREELTGAGHGAAQQNVSTKDLVEIELPIPPLAEQHRIVGLLDEAFEGIATAKANAAKNLQNARALFESHLQSVFSQRGKGWVEKSVAELVEDGVLQKPFDGNHGEIHPKKADYTPSGVPFIMACDLVNGFVDTKGCTFISRKQADSLRVGFAKIGDVLISHKGTIGRSAILETDDDYIMLTPQVTAYRVLNSDRLSNRFVRFYFMSPGFQREMIAGAADGSTRAYIGITKQLGLGFRFPSLSEQERIVTELDVLDPETQRLVSLYTRKLAALEALKKSLLHLAFSGEL
jgi:type I restriction enzyme, S subunit